jgi:chemotaxis methyl-accepting protein methylase
MKQQHFLQLLKQKQKQQLQQQKRQRILQLACQTGQEQVQA